MLTLRIPAVIIMALVLAIGTVAPRQSAAQLSPAAVPSVQANFQLSGSSSSETGKYPRTEAFANTVHIVSNPGAEVTYWTKADSSGSTSSPSNLGSVSSKTTYSNAAVALGADGTAYVAWINQGSGLFLRSKSPNGNWGTTFPIHRTGSFLSYVDVAVSTAGTIVAAWNEASVFQYRYSTNGGASWSGSNPVSSRTPRGAIRLASGPNGAIAAAFASNTGHVYASLWNGSGFDSTDLTPSVGRDDFFAEPSVTIAPNGKVYVAWRNVPGGLYYTERQSDGSWPVSRLISGQVYSEVAISADRGNNLHIAWAGEPTNKWDVWYAFKPAGGNWEGPIQVTDSGLFVANPDLGSSINSSSAFGHVVYEAFSGSSSSNRYALFSSAITPPLSAQPVIENGASATNKNTVSVSFSGIQGSPKELRWNWGSAPTDADHDSTGTNGWETFTNPKSIALPAGATACQTLRLYTQVKDGTAIEISAKSATTQFDNAVQAAVDVVNPHMAGLPATFLSTADNSTTSASEGSPSYTREPYAYLRISDAGDCSGLSSFSVSTGNPSPAPAFTNGSYVGTVPLPQTNINAGGGTASISVAINDSLANLNNFAREIIYDPADTDSSTTVTNTAGLPVVNGGSVTADNAASVIQTLTLSNLNVTDNVYGPKEGLSSTREFWGLWMANTTDPNEAATSDKLLWYPVRVPDPNANPLKVKWSIFTGLNFGLDPNKSGTYFVFVRFLDGAGNPSAASTARKVTVTLPAGYSFPTLDMPMITK